jgi:hypothetical protein
METNHPDLKCKHNLSPKRYTSNSISSPGRCVNILPNRFHLSDSHTITCPDRFIAAQSQSASSATYSVSVTYTVNRLSVYSFPVWMDELPSPSQSQALPPTPQSSQASSVPTLHEPPSTPTPLSRKRASPNDTLSSATLSWQSQKRARHGDEAEGAEVSAINLKLGLDFKHSTPLVGPSWTKDQYHKIPREQFFST